MPFVLAQGKLVKGSFRLADRINVPCDASCFLGQICSDFGEV